MHRISTKGLVIFLLFAATAGMANDQDRAAELRSAFAQCRLAFQDRRLDVIRDKVPLDGKYPVSAPQRKPSADEAEVLRLLHAAQVKCSMAFNFGARGVKLDSPLMLSAYAHEHLSGLVLLANGYTTYDEDSRWRKAREEKAVQDAVERARQDDEALKKEKR